MRTTYSLRNYTKFFHVLYLSDVMELNIIMLFHVLYLSDVMELNIIMEYTKHNKFIIKMH